MATTTMAVGRIDAAQIVRDEALFLQAFLRIQDKRRRLIPLIPNRAQRHYLAHRTQRDLILKPRQIGFSTLIQAILYRAAVVGAASTLTLAHTHDSTQMLRRMADRFHANMPIQPARLYANATLATYTDFGSEAMIATAGGRHVGRGATITHLHGSEVAFWAEAEAAAVAALQSVAADGWVVFESTPNGARGYFYELCMGAMRGDNDWTLHFYPWWWAEDYQRDETVSDLTEHERYLMDAHEVSMSQIAWRRAKVREIGERAFAQEYPEDPTSCFLTSGDALFGDLRAVLYDAVEYGGEPTVMGVDWGQVDDATAASIMTADGREVHLERMVRMPWAAMRARLIDLAQQWNVQRVVAERNSIGAVNIEALRDESAARGVELDIVAFEMTQLRKSHLVSVLIEAVSSAAIRLLDNPVATAEMNAYQTVQNANGLWSYGHPPGGHDDTVDARMLALWGVRGVYGSK